MSMSVQLGRKNSTSNNLGRKIVNTAHVLGRKFVGSIKRVGEILTPENIQKGISTVKNSLDTASNVLGGAASLGYKYLPMMAKAGSIIGGPELGILSGVASGAQKALAYKSKIDELRNIKVKNKK